MVGKKKCVEEKKAKSISSERKNSPNRFVRPDIAAHSSHVLQMDVERQRKLSQQSTPSIVMSRESVVYEDDPPNISKLKQEINGIMNDLIGPEGALNNDTAENIGKMASPSLSHIADMPLELSVSTSQSFDPSPSVSDDGKSKTTINNGNGSPEKRNLMPKEQGDQNTSASPGYNTLPSTNPSPLGNSSSQFKREVDDSF